MADDYRHRDNLPAEKYAIMAIDGGVAPGYALAHIYTRPTKRKETAFPIRRFSAFQMAKETAERPTYGLTYELGEGENKIIKTRTEWPRPFYDLEILSRKLAGIWRHFRFVSIRHYGVPAQNTFLALERYLISDFVSAKYEAYAPLILNEKIVSRLEQAADDFEAYDFIGPTHVGSVVYITPGEQSGVK